MSKVFVIGGGIIGLMSAYYLNKSGHEVAIADKYNFEKSCSYGNAGMIVPSHIISLAAPGVITMGLKWMLNPGSPFGFNFSLNKDLISWVWNFYRSSNKTHVNNSKIPLRDFNLFSRELYQELSRSFDFNLKNTGILQMFKSDKAGKHEIAAAKEAKHLGLDVEVLSGKEVQRIEQIEVDVAGAVYYKCDSHIYPVKLIMSLLEYLKKNNVSIYYDCEVINFEINNHTISAAVASSQKFYADYFVIAAGMWSGKLCRKLNINLPIQSGKGYSITKKDFKNPPRYPSLLLETRAAVTPLGNDLRLAGTMEIGSGGNEINIRRVKGYLEKIKDYYPGINPVVPGIKDIWVGHRPCSPDGLPYIGKSEKFKNLIFAAGHAMMGLSLGPASGKIVQELVDNRKISLDLAPYKPERF